MINKLRKSNHLNKNLLKEVAIQGGFIKFTVK